MAAPKIILLFLLVTLLVPIAHSLGIGPAKIQIDFEQGDKEYKQEFIVVNEADAEKPIELYVTGDEEAAKYFKLSQIKAVLKPKETRGFSFTAKFPDDLSPGQHKVRIGAVESAAGGGQFGARVGVELFVLVEVPVPGKYLTIDQFYIQNANAGQPTQLSLKVTNRGRETIEKITAVFEILDSKNKRTAAAILSESNLKLTESKTMETEIKTAGFVAGKYHANAEVTYDGIKKSTETNFRVGDLVINIIKVYGDSIKKDTIGKIFVDYESQWSETIKDVRPELKIYLGSNKIAETQGQQFSVEPFTAGTAAVFWDTRGLNAGEYDIQAVLSYENRTSTGSGKIRIVSFETGWLLAVLLIAIIIISMRIIKRRGKR
ncbi:MAG: hypothetical protein HYT16_00285 [DPANN group archaeon]|nr:hypothetical protein [DPANN group archaeon]